jgi:UDP-GlcNAc:undecaprenyl-phosphate GlcNAc-1-phosphate transferase
MKFNKILYVFILILTVYLFNPKGGTWFYLHNIRWLYVLLLSTGFAVLFTPIARYMSFKTKIYDMPNERKIHAVPMPLLGGLAVYGAMMLTIFRNLKFNSELTGIIIGGTLIFLIGVVDDIKGVRGRYKLFAQILAALIIIKFGVRITVIPTWWPGENIIEILLTILGVVGITNAFNYFDGMDGLASGLAIVTSLCISIVGLQTGQQYVTWLAIALLGSCLGFIPFNWKPAKIFLGDAGSNYIGFNLAALTIMGSWGVKNPVVATTIPLLILSIYIFDMIYTSVARIRNGNVTNFTEWLEYAAKDHLHHRLVRLNFSEPKAVLIICLMSFSLGISALVLRRAGIVESIFVITQALLMYLIIVLLMLAGREITNNKIKEENI